MAHARGAQQARQASTRDIFPWLARLPWHDRVLLALVAIALVLRLWPVGGLSTDYDEGVYWQSLRALADGHPLFTQIFSSQPPLFLLGIYPFYLLLGQDLVAARLAVVLFSLIGLAAIYAAARAIAGRWAGLAACALLSVDPVFLRVSHTLQAEAPALALQLVCVALAAAAGRRLGRPRHILSAASGVALGFGITIKLFDVVALLPALLYLITPLSTAACASDGRAHRLSPEALLAQTRPILTDLGLFAGGALAALLVVSLPFAGRWAALYDQVVRFHLVAGQSVDRGPGYNLALLLQTRVVYPLLFAGVIAVVIALRARSWIVVPPALWFLASLALLLHQQPLFDHHLALLMPPLALMAGVSVSLVLAQRRLAREPARPHSYISGRGVAQLALILVLTMLVLSVGDTLTAAQPITDDRRLISIALERLTIPSDVVVTDDQYIAGLAGRSVVPELVDTSEVRIASSYLTTPQIEAVITRADARVILFASGRLDRLPGFRAWVRAHYTEVATFGSGRALYLRQPTSPVPV